MAKSDRLAVLRPIGGGVSQMRKILRETEKVLLADARLTTNSIAKEVLIEAKRRAPRESGNLESAIKLRQGGRDGRALVVYVDEKQAPYAHWMHEGLFDFSDPDFDGYRFEYELGPGSKNKNSGTPHKEPGGVGLKFLERGAAFAVEKKGRPAWERHQKRIAAKIAQFGRLFLR